MKTKYANIINIAAKEEVIPELLQSNCNAHNIYKYVVNFLDNPEKITYQLNKIDLILKTMKTESNPAQLAAHSLNKLIT